MRRCGCAREAQDWGRHGERSLRNPLIHVDPGSLFRTDSQVRDVKGISQSLTSSHPSISRSARECESIAASAPRTQAVVLLSQSGAATARERQAWKLGGTATSVHSRDPMNNSNTAAQEGEREDARDQQGIYGETGKKREKEEPRREETCFHS